jgi:hypothetical protein
MIHLKINNRDHAFDGDPDMPLLWYLRARDDGRQVRVWCGAVRGVHSSPQRRSHSLVFDPDERGGGEIDYHHRGAERGGRASAAEGLGGC